ncbi:uncharacterized protein LOC120184554 isoform X1 [Hibiscus syriacus]|uniref:uncharacterized protein LOC120184554 isoform X1 n=1 Tax=Hibiscus syriacus TaxID=106335 RepID=UPI0019217D5D|nr:uncharacterized protein LOC120184554 isoform X1 [Hibiscus syriacus]
MGSDGMTSGSAAATSYGGVQIPASVKRVVQNLKEIVNNSCTDSEIYAVLKDCNMDPSDAVQRLLSQDTFHEVKSKRERRKEMKETQELKARVDGCASNRGVRDSSEHSFGRSGSILNSCNELGKATYKKENDSVAYMPHSASSNLHSTGQTLNDQLFPPSNSFDGDYRRQSIGSGDVIDSSMQPSYGSRSSWVGSTVEHAAMADIVRLGRPKSKGSQMSCETPYSLEDAVPPNSTIYQMKPSLATSDSKLGADQDLHFLDSNMTFESGKKSSQHVFDNEWAVNEPMKGSDDIGGTMYSNQSNLHSSKTNLSSRCWSDNILVSESNVGWKNLSHNHVSSAQASNKRIFTSDSGGPSEYDDDLCKDTDSYGQICERLEVAGRGYNASAPNPSAPLSDDAVKAASSVAVNLRQLSLGKEEEVVTLKEDNCGVVLPDYLQALSADCSHLSFGTYKSGKSTALPQSQTSSSLTNNLEETLMTSNCCSTSMHSDFRNLLYNDKEQLDFDFDSHRANVDARNYNSPNFSQSNLRKLDIPDAATLGNDYVSFASIPNSSFKNMESSSSLSSVIDPNARNLPILPNAVQSHSNSMPSDILAAAIQSRKARDSAAFLTSASISSRYISSASSMKSPIEPMSQSSSQVLHGANSATGPLLKEHWYGYYPQNSYMAPSALRQAFPDGGNVFREPHIDMMYDRQHYGSASMCSSLPWSSSYASGYRSLENPSHAPGSPLQNLLSGSVGSRLAYDNFLYSQYSDGGSNFNLPQQNGGTAAWDYRHGSRTISTIPDNANYSLHGQNHLLAGYQQGQQQSQQQLHGALGYPGTYGSHAAMAMEQQQQNRRDSVINASQGPSSRQLPQPWQQHKY